MTIVWSFFIYGKGKLRLALRVFDLQQYIFWRHTYYGIAVAGEPVGIAVVADAPLADIA